MIQKSKLLTLLLPALIVCPSILSAKSLQNKQLAGPPEEFELMRQAQPEKSALNSKTALIPVSLQQTKGGNWYWSGKLPVDSNSFSFMTFANGSTDWQVSLINPKSGKSYAADTLASEHISTNFGLENSSYPGEKYSFDNLVTGNWIIEIKTTGEPEQFEGFVLASSNSKYILNSYKTNTDQIVGHKIHFVTQSTSNENTLSVLKQFSPIDEAFMVVTKPDGTQNKFNMYDDGKHGDKRANDGMFGGDFSALQSGGYTVQINASGNNPDGTPFYRTSEHFVPVVDQTISLSSNKALNQVSATAISDNRLNIAFNIDDNSKAANNSYRIIAEVWGKNNSNSKSQFSRNIVQDNMKPISWISTMTSVENNQLNIELDARWMEMAKVSDSFELRNLRIEDGNHFIPLITQKSMPLNITSMPQMKSKKFNGSITEEMMMGEKPAQTSTTKGVGTKLLLVHGYCSSDVWGPYQYQFSNSAKFTDFNQNISHNTFAQRIKNFGSTWNSFGVVAHSQGGAASLHLYTYYWSGLDYSTSGKRMIQSVGTPYQGTPIAGNLAALGNVFGVGCGYNSNLTTSGASSWLAGIPTWARSKVNYFTTSNTDRWWQYNYCSLGTDLFLSDPDDGVIEKFRGQLSGATNRGHKTGWCHTLSMNYSGQTSDSSRNYSMSANANR
jgi:hypothetical protein